MSDVKIVRLVTGEELICRCEETGHGSYKLTNILILIPTAERQLSWSPFMPYAEISDKEGIEINSSHIMFKVHPVHELLSQYISAFSNLVLPNNPSAIH